MKKLHGKQYCSYSNAARAIKNFEKKYKISLKKVGINQLDYGCYEILVY